MNDQPRLVEALGPELAAHLGPRMEPVELAAGEHLVDAGVPSPWLFVLHEGWIEVQRAGPKGPVILGALRPGALVGEIGFVDGGPATATLVATERCVLSRLDRAALPGLQREAPLLTGQLLHRISTTMAERLDQTSRTVAKRSSDRTPPRRRARVRKLLGRLLGVG